MYLSIIVLPLLGSIFSGFFGRVVGVSGARFLTSSSIIITTILAIIAFFEVGFNNSPVFLHLFKWINSESFNIIWSFQFDSLTVSMLIPVLIISSLVHIYSIGYMSSDPHNQRFFSYLSLFTFMMIILVTADNYLLMFVGWEGVGVCSYLLVSFWFTRIAANQSSLSAFLTNRVGDWLLAVGMFAILWSLGNLDYTLAFSLSPYINENTIIIIGICLLIGAMAKSSQLGLHVWLPMAMEGPTPVSALIHAATMVTAGVYLLIRSSPLIEYSSTILLICLWLGAITTVFSSLVGLFQQDIKKIIAYSTMSQLGMMVIAIGLSSYNIALFHLVNHAFYKGLLFLGAGAVIHGVGDNQDLRKYGGLKEYLPLTYSVILIASLSLVAFPFMTGFYSKDFILESAYGQYEFSSVAVYVIAVIGAIFTTLYSVKILYLAFLSNPNGPSKHYNLNSENTSHEGDIFLILPLVVLAIFSIYFGFITKDLFIGLGSGFFIDNSIFIHPTHEILIDTEFGVPVLFKLLPFFYTILFTIISLIYFEFLPNLVVNFKLSNLGYYIYGFFNQRFLVEFFYNKYIVNLVLNMGGQTTKILDKGSIEILGPYGLEKTLLKISKIISGLNKGIVTNYALYILIGLVSYIFIYNSLGENLDLSLLILLFSVIMLVIFNTSFVNLSNISNTKITTLESSLMPSNLTKTLYSFLNKLTFSVLISAIILLIKNVFFYDDNLFLFDEEDDKKEDKGKNPERDSTVSKDEGKLEESKDKKEEELSEEEIIARHEKAAEERKRAMDNKLARLFSQHIQKTVIPSINDQLRDNDFNEREDSELTAEQINYRKGLEDWKNTEIKWMGEDMKREIVEIERQQKEDNLSSSADTKRFIEEEKEESSSKKKKINSTLFIKNLIYCIYYIIDTIKEYLFKIIYLFIVYYLNKRLSKEENLNILCSKFKF